MRYRIMIALGMVLFLVGVLTVGASASDVCGPLDSGKIDTSGDPMSVTVTAPDGKLIDGFCVKAGSSNQGDGPVYVEVDPPLKSITIMYQGGEKAVSHYSVSYTEVETTTTTQPEETTTTTIVITTTTTSEPPETTTTTAVVTTTTPETTTTEVVTTTTEEPPDEECVDDPSTDENECELPFTGIALESLALVAVGLILMGYGILKIGRTIEAEGP